MNSKSASIPTSEPELITLVQLAQVLTQHLLVVIRNQGCLNVSQAQLLVLSRFQNGTTITRLAHQLGSSKQAVSLLVKQLIVTGYLKSQCCEQDHRSFLLFLTESGLAVKSAIDLWSRQVNNLLISKLGASTFGKLSKEIPALITQIQQLPELKTTA